MGKEKKQAYSRKRETNWSILTWRDVLTWRDAWPPCHPPCYWTNANSNNQEPLFSHYQIAAVQYWWGRREIGSVGRSLKWYNLWRRQFGNNFKSARGQCVHCSVTGNNKNSKQPWFVNRSYDAPLEWNTVGPPYPQVPYPWIQPSLDQIFEKTRCCCWHTIVLGS